MKDLYKQIYSRDNPPGDAHGWIQWKGTDVCIDLHCKCGAHMHFDGDFFYNFKCPHCGRCYAVGQNVALIEMTAEEVENRKGHCWQTVLPDEDEESAEKIKPDPYSVPGIEYSGPEIVVVHSGGIAVEDFMAAQDACINRTQWRGYYVVEVESAAVRDDVKLSTTIRGFKLSES